MFPKKTSIVLIFFLLTVSMVRAPMVPTVVRGNAYLEKQIPEKGTVIKAKIDGELVGEDKISENGKFLIDINAKPSSNGQKIEFFVDDFKADQTFKFEPGKVKELNITANKGFLNFIPTGLFIETPGSLILLILILGSLGLIYAFKFK